MAAIRVHRTVEAKPGKLRDVMKAAFTMANQVKESTGKEVQIYCSRFTAGSIGSLHIYADFESMAEYEATFIEGVLGDENYLRALEAGSELIKDHPRDELIVRLDAERDFFMSLA